MVSSLATPQSQHSDKGHRRSKVKAQSKTLYTHSAPRADTNSRLLSDRIRRLASPKETLKEKAQTDRSMTTGTSSSTCQHSQQPCISYHHQRGLFLDGCRHSAYKKTSVPCTALKELRQKPYSHFKGCRKGL